MIECDATDCINHKGNNRCDLDRVRISVKIGAMAKDQYEAHCAYFITHRETQPPKRRKKK